MYNSNLSSILQVVLIRFVYVIGLIFIIGNSKFVNKQENKFKNKIANILLILISTIVLLVNMKNEIVVINQYWQSLVSGFSVIFDIVLAIILILYIIEMCKNKALSTENKIIKASIFTGIITILLHIKFFSYVNSYVFICSQNEIPVFSIVLMQFFVIVLLFKYFKNFKGKNKDNIKIFLLILLYLTLVCGRMHMTLKFSLKSYLDVILDITDDMIINIMSMGLFTYIINMIDFPDKNKIETKENKEDLNEQNIKE